MEKWQKLLFLTVLIFLIIVCAKKDKQAKDHVEFVSFEDSTIVAMVNGEPIHELDVNETAKLMLLQTGQSDQMSYQDSAIQRQSLDQFISNTLLKQEVVKHIIEVKEEEIENAIRIVERRLPPGETLESTLQNQNLTMRKFRDNLVLELKVQKLVQNEVLSQVTEIDTAEAKKFYEENPMKFTRPMKAHARHILIRMDKDASEEKVNNARQKAQSILTRIKQGEDFVELAKNFSEDPTGRKGGDLGFFSKGDMVPEFDEQVFLLKPGEVSELVRTKFGFHIIKVEEFKDSEQTPYEKVEKNIIAYLKQMKSQESFDNYIQKLKQKAKIQMREDLKWTMKTQ